MTTTLSNPLLDFSGLPRFSDIKTEHVAPAIEALLNENKTILDNIRHDSQPPTWSTFVQPIVDATERLSRAWGQVSHLNAVMNSPELRAAYNKNLPLITQFYAELSQDQHLFEKFKQLRASREYAALSPARKKIVEDELRDFRLGGAELPDEQKQRFLKIQEALSETSSQFNDNLLDATNAFSLLTDNPQDVAGIPEDALHAARQLAEQEGKPGWKFTLHMPSYLPVQQYADHRELREKMYRAYNTRASEFDAIPPKDDQDEAKSLDNMPLINKILELRAEEARLLGFNNYAEVSLATKMAESPQQVLDFLRELAVKAKPYAERDLQELQQFAAEQLNLSKLEVWDIPYVSEKLRQARYAFSDQEVKQYFPENKVLPGMFRLVEKLYRITITPADATRNIQYWHPDVRLYDIFDANGALIGQFYLDLYARASKRGGAWMDSAISRRLVEQKQGKPVVQIPVAYLTCNFSAPVAVNSRPRPALFTHNEVIVLFHEFGHGLHHLLTQVDDLSVSGISGVEWDAVELPSQFMENFCWEWDVLTGMTGHVETGEPLPRALYEKMLAARNFQSGMQMVRQIEFALFDMRLHSDFNPQGGKTVLQLLDEVRSEAAVVFPPAYHRFPNNFAHIFGGGYAAGYYSYKWAEVLSADAYGMFEERAAGSAEGVLNADVGARFRQEILAMGGSRPALESFVAFRGRTPQMDALLRHNGMAA
jgi:oligopeptidase A